MELLEHPGTPRSDGKATQAYDQFAAGISATHDFKKLHQIVSIG